jgi:hypothetical protein
MGRIYTMSMTPEIYGAGGTAIGAVSVLIIKYLPKLIPAIAASVRGIEPKRQSPKNQGYDDDTKWISQSTLDSYCKQNHALHDKDHILISKDMCAVFEDIHVIKEEQKVQGKLISEIHGMIAIRGTLK